MSSSFPSYFRRLPNHSISTGNLEQVSSKSHDQKYEGSEDINVPIKVFPRTQLRFLQLWSNKQWYAIMWLKQSYTFASLCLWLCKKGASFIQKYFGERQNSLSVFNVNKYIIFYFCYDIISNPVLTDQTKRNKLIYPDISS